MFPTRLRKEIIALLCLKALVLTLIYFAWVKPAEGPELDRGQILTHLTGGG